MYVNIYFTMAGLYNQWLYSNDLCYSSNYFPFSPGLFYDGIGNEIGTEMAMIEANKLNVAAAAEALRAAKEEENRIKAEAAAAAAAVAHKEELEAAVHEANNKLNDEDGTGKGKGAHRQNIFIVTELR